MNCGCCASARLQHQLALAARDHGVGPRCKLGDAEPIQHGCCDLAIRSGRPGEQVAMRGASHQHDGLHREREGRDMGLRHIGDQARAFPDRTRRQRRSGSESSGGFVAVFHFDNR